MRIAASRIWWTVSCAVAVLALTCAAQDSWAQGGGGPRGKMPPGRGRGMMGGMQQNQGMGGQGMQGGGMGMGGQGMQGGGMGMGGQGMGGQGMQGGGMGGAGGMHGQGGQGGMGGQGMMNRQQLLANMDVAPHDPAAVLAMKDQLELTPQQVKNLEKALERVRQQSHTILTKKQREKLQTLVEAPPAAKAP